MVSRVYLAVQESLEHKVNDKSRIRNNEFIAPSLIKSANDLRSVTDEVSRSIDSTECGQPALLSLRCDMIYLQF